MNGYNDHVACLLTCETCTVVYIYISTIDDYLRSYMLCGNQQTSKLYCIGQPGQAGQQQKLEVKRRCFLAGLPACLPALPGIF